MPWNGYNDGENDVNDKWAALENCSLDTKGECRRRLGFGAKVDLSSAVVRSAAELGNYALCATAAGAVLSIVQSTGVVASLATGLGTTNWPTWAGMNGRMYYTNGVEVRVSDDGTNFRTVGITAPSVSPTPTNTGSGGVVQAGEHYFRYRYYDSTRNRLSDPSTAVALTVTAGSKVAVAYTASGDSTVDKIIIEMTPFEDSTYYRAATIANSGTTTTVDISDNNLILQISAASTGSFNHSPPPVGTIIVEHRQRLWQISGKTLYWSRAMYPESWSSVNYARDITLDAGDTITGAMSYYSDLYIFGSRCMRRFIHTSDPAAAMVQDVPSNLGIFNQRCVIKTDDGLMVGWGKNGMWVIDAMRPKKISSNIDDQLDTLADPTNVTQRFICYEPIRREIYFFFPSVGSTTCKNAWVYGIDNQEWILNKYRQPITSAVLNTQYSDRQRLMLIDANGYAWRIGVSANDGGDDGYVTVTSGSSTTVVNCVNNAVVGQTLYNPTTGEERLITVATGSAVTVAALAQAPTAGTVMYIGSIRQRMLTNWNPGDGLNEKKRPTKFLIAVRPEGTLGTGIVNYYQDFSATAVEATAFASDAFAEGVTVSGTQLTLNLDTGAADGVMSVPTPADWKRVIRAEIITESPYDGVRFIEASFRGDSSIKEEEE